MSDHDKEIDRAARDFIRATSALSKALLAKLAAESPEMAAQVARSLEQGERMLLAMEFQPEGAAIWWATINDYQHMKRIMTLPTVEPVRR